MKDRTYFASALGDRGVALLNGTAVRDVIACDTEKGWVDHFVRGADGKLILGHNTVEARRSAGRVEFIPADEMQPR